MPAAHLGFSGELIPGHAIPGEVAINYDRPANGELV